jgi:ADP-ribosylglycohydrolase
VCFAANTFNNANPRDAILVAANHRDVDENGRLVRFRDNDCTGYVTGALAGAMAGSRKLPVDWIDKVIASNKEIYGIDIEANVHGFCTAVHDRR